MAGGELDWEDVGEAGYGGGSDGGDGSDGNDSGQEEEDPFLDFCGELPQDLEGLTVTLANDSKKGAPCAAPLQKALHATVRGFIATSNDCRLIATLKPVNCHVTCRCQEAGAERPQQRRKGAGSAASSQPFVVPLGARPIAGCSGQPPADASYSAVARRARSCGGGGGGNGRGSAAVAGRAAPADAVVFRRLPHLPAFFRCGTLHGVWIR